MLRNSSRDLWKKRDIHCQQLCASVSAKLEQTHWSEENEMSTFVWKLNIITTGMETMCFVWFSKNRQIIARILPVLMPILRRLIYVSHSMRPTDTWGTHLGIICETIWMVVCDHAALWSILSVSLCVLLSLFGCLFGTVAFWLAAHTKPETERNEKCSNPFTCQCIWWNAEISLNSPIFWA